MKDQHNLGMGVLMLIQPDKNPLEVIIAQNVDYTDKLG